MHGVKNGHGTMVTALSSPSSLNLHRNSLLREKKLPIMTVAGRTGSFMVKVLPLSSFFLFLTPGVMHDETGIYNGEWKAGVRSGRGKSISKDGAIYEGSWDNDQKNGKGVIEDPGGYIKTYITFSLSLS